MVIVVGPHYRNYILEEKSQSRMGVFATYIKWNCSKWWCSCWLIDRGKLHESTWTNKDPSKSGWWPLCLQDKIRLVLWGQWIVQLKIVPPAVIEWQSKMLLHQNLDHITSLLKIQQRILVWKKCSRGCTNKISVNQKLWFQIVYWKTSVKFHMIEVFWILLKGKLSKVMDIMLFFYHFVIKSWLCQTTSNKQLKD